MGDKLTYKQERFSQEILIDGNGTRAAKAAGFSEKTASEQASRLLANVKISSRIAELKAARSIRTEITADYVLTGLKLVAERCLQQEPVRVWDYEEKAMVQVKDADDNNVWTFDSQGANRAFELLGKHIGLFEKDNNQKGKTISVEIN